MRFNRVLGELLLSGMIAGVATVVPATRPAATSPSSNLPLATPTAQQRIESDSLAWLSNLIGITQFVKNPTQYSVLFEEALGQVTDASLKEDVMTISFRYPTEDEMRTGELTGTVDSDGLFVGVYQTQSGKGSVEGEIMLSFVADGTARGSYGDAAEMTRIFL